MLTESQAVEIYLLKISNVHDGSGRTSGKCKRGQSVPIGARYGVSSRTIRDIWNRKTWSFATQHLWHMEGSRPFETHVQVETIDSLLLQVLWCSMKPSFLQGRVCFRQPGRPRGSQDSKARKIHPGLLQDISTTNVASIVYLENPETDAEGARVEQNPLRINQDAICEFGDPFHDDWLYW